MPWHIAQQQKGKSYKKEYKQFKANHWKNK
jgi:hypothetical protein